MVGDRISVDPAICSGKPHVRGTRIMVKNILGMFAGGYATERILEAYPELTREDVRAALGYAQALVDEGRAALQFKGPYLTPEYREQFWVHACLLSDPQEPEAPREPLGACLRRAYLDMCRTRGGVQKIVDKAKKANRGSPTVTDQATGTLRGQFEILKQSSGAREQNDFDEWHRESCGALARAYAAAGYKAFHVGQAQKWINMTFKYIFLLNNRLPGYKEVYQWCHVPIDQRVLDALNCHGPHPLKGTPNWSHIDDYDCYLDFQKWVRAEFRASPLDVEFWSWIGRHEIVAALRRKK